MTKAPSTQPLPPHFRCDCVPDLGPAHCHRCSQNAGVIVDWDSAVCKELVESFVYGALLSAGADASLRLTSDAFDKKCAAAQESKVEHLTAAPPVGTAVRLLADSWYLREYHSASVGSIGTVVQHSHLNPDDNGVLVDWGDSQTVRCNLEELAMEPA